MKKFLLFLFFIGLFSCSSDLDDVKKEIEELEREAQNLRKEREDLEKNNTDQEISNQEKEEQIRNAERQQGITILKSMEFLLVDNPIQMVSDEKCSIIDNSVVECWIPYLMPNKKLVPRFEFNGIDLTLNGSSAVSGFTLCDFSKPVNLVISSKTDSKNYSVFVHAFTGLPVLWIETDDREGFSENDDYMNAKLKLVEDVVTRGAGDVIEENIKIKRDGDVIYYTSQYDGNTHTGKNSYVIKFNSKISMIDEPQSDEWALFTTDKDITMLRSQAGFYMGSISRLSRSMTFHYVELMLNGRYCGTYLLGDRTEVSHRYEVKTEGLTMIIDGGGENSSSVSSFINEVENVLFSSSFTDKNIGWQKYLDIESFVDWYVISEMLKGGKSSSTLECYANLMDGMLKIGPLVKTDMSMGVYDNDVKGLIVKKSKWFNRLLQDPVFESEVKKRFDYFYGKKDEIKREIENNAQYLRYSVVENSNRWEIFMENSDAAIYSMYISEVNTLLDWFDARMEWLKGEFK